jgi:hypothetical protein
MNAIELYLGLDVHKDSITIAIAEPTPGRASSRAGRPPFPQLIKTPTHSNLFVGRGQAGPKPKAPNGGEN